MKLFDSHLHLNHEKFQNQEAEIWQSANQAGVNQAVVVGYDLQSSQRAIALAENLPGLYASVGVSPHDILEAPDDYYQQLEIMAQHPSVAAIGECGLEYHYPAGPKDIQIKHFLKQSKLAKDLGKILIIHLREADEDFLNILDTEPPHAAILHCFTASTEVMEKSVELGYYISFSGILTFKNAKDLHAIAPQVPASNLLIETDSPYLAPIPYRGKMCEPKMIVETAQKLAELREEELGVIIDQTRINAQKAFKITD